MDSATPALASIGIDIGKDVFHLVGFDRQDRVPPQDQASGASRGVQDPTGLHRG